jgi:hypothetical protein
MVGTLRIYVAGSLHASRAAITERLCSDQLLRLYSSIHAGVSGTGPGSTQVRMLHIDALRRCLQAQLWPNFVSNARLKFSGWAWM